MNRKIRTNTPDLNDELVGENQLREMRHFLTLISQLMTLGDDPAPQPKPAMQQAAAKLVEVDDLAVGDHELYIRTLWEARVLRFHSREAAQAYAASLSHEIDQPVAQVQAIEVKRHTAKLHTASHTITRPLYPTDTPKPSRLGVRPSGLV